MNFPDAWPLPDQSKVLENQSVALRPINLTEDLDQLFAAASLENNHEDIFRFHVNAGPFQAKAEFRGYLQAKLANSQDRTYAVFSQRLQRLVGCVSLLNIQTKHGTVEVGAIWYAKSAQRSEVNSQTMLLLFAYIFEDLGYRRLEWKCNSLNQASQDAALRLGFTYEGTFRQHYVSRGENRDTCWYSLLDSEWPERKAKLTARTSAASREAR